MMQMKMKRMLLLGGLLSLNSLCGIAAAVLVAAGIAAFQSYGSYGTQDNSLLMQNVEALAQGPDGGDGDGGEGSLVSNKAIEYVYGSEYKPTGFKANIDIDVDLLKILSKMIGKTYRSKAIDANVSAYMTYESYQIYQKNCVDYPGSKCVCSTTNNGVWIKKPKPQPSWWGTESKVCY